MNLKKLTPDIFFITFPNRKELTFTMCRVEEYYEAASDNLRGKVFTWPEFIDEFTTTDGHFDYFHSWSGFNVPGATFNSWATKFKDMSSRELELIRLVFASMQDYTDSRYYVIATVEGDDSVEEHEIAHALYYVNDEYRSKMEKLNASLDVDVRLLLTNEFAILGYSHSVFEDELQAFLSTSDFEYMNKRFGMTEEMYDRVTPNYCAVFSNHN